MKRKENIKKFGIVRGIPRHGALWLVIDTTLKTDKCKKKKKYKIGEHEIVE